MEISFVMLKPGVVNRRIVGEVISRFERKGLQLVGMKMIRVSDETAASHYAEHFGKSFYQDLVDYITSGPVVAMAWQGDDCVAQIRKLVGATKPSDAQPGTIRGDYCTHTNHNVVHASDSPESGQREVSLYFKDDELCFWKDELECWM